MKRSVIFALGWTWEIEELREAPVHKLITGHRVRYPYNKFEVENTREGLRQAEKKLHKEVKEWAKAVRRFSTLEYKTKRRSK